MLRYFLFVLPALLGLAAATTQPASDKPKPPAADNLLLLDDASDSKPAAENMADNSRCQVCHLNLIEEDLVVKHAKAKVGCATCHGASDEHIADESWSNGDNGTAPDVIFRKVEINSFCLRCHPKEKVTETNHKPFFEDTTEQKLCTDCHGKHRIPNRKCKWK